MQSGGNWGSYRSTLPSDIAEKLSLCVVSLIGPRTWFFNDETRLSTCVNTSANKSTKVMVAWQMQIRLNWNRHQSRMRSRSSTKWRMRIYCVSFAVFPSLP